MTISIIVYIIIAMIPIVMVTICFIHALSCRPGYRRRADENFTGPDRRSHVDKDCAFSGSCAKKCDLHISKNSKSNKETDTTNL
jgi:hypothetical protein